MIWPTLVETQQGYLIRKLTLKGWVYRRITNPSDPNWLRWERVPVYQPDQFLAMLAWFSKHEEPK